MSRFFTRFPIGGLGEPEIYHQSVWITICGGIYDIVVIFDLVVFWWVVEEGSQFFHETRLQFLLSLTPFRFIMKIGTLLCHSKKVMRTRQELI